MKTSFFKSMRGRGNPMPLLQILGQIQGGKWAAQIAQLRDEQNPDRAKKLKRRLPGFTPSCETDGTHKASGAIDHSGFICVDIDHVGMEAAIDLRDAIKGHTSAFAAWVSPSGDGLKVLISIPADISRHAESFAAVERLFLERWQVKIDPSCKDIARLCFVSFDADLWINSDAVEIELEEGREYLLKEKGNHTQSPPTFSATPTRCTLPLHTTSTQQEGKDPKKECGLPKNLLVLYSALCNRRLSDVEPGTRNAWLCELIPLWHHALSECVAMQFAEAFWREHQGVFHDPLEQHLNEARTLYRGLESSYASGLSEGRRAIFATLEPDLAIAFKICLGLVGIDSELPPDQFFISCDQLGHRTGFVSMKAYRLILELLAKGIIEIARKGTRRVTGKQGKATVYKFLIP